MPNDEIKITKEILLRALSLLSDGLGHRGIKGELCICGGSALMLAFDAREATRDLDSVFVPTGAIREVAVEVSTQMNLPDDWINDGVKGYFIGHPEMVTDGMPQFKNLEIKRPSTEYLFFMKCWSCRIGESKDVDDIAFLIRQLGIRDMQEAMQILNKYDVNGTIIGIKTQYVLESILND